MNRSIKVRSALSGIRRHPVRAAAICVPLLAASVFTGSSMASATPEQTLAVSPAQLNATPAPHVLIVDNQATGKVVTSTDGTTVPKETWNIDGCDHNYGAPNECVPWTIPGSTSQAQCAWLSANGFGALKVYGTNRQNLPENAEGYACA